MYGPPGGGTAALLEAVVSLGAPAPALERTRPARELLEIVDVIGLEDTDCESCQQRPARYLESLPGVLVPFLLCPGCLL